MLRLSCRSITSLAFTFLRCVKVVKHIHIHSGPPVTISAQDANKQIYSDESDHEKIASFNSQVFVFQTFLKTDFARAFSLFLKFKGDDNISSVMAEQLIKTLISQWSSKTNTQEIKKHLRKIANKLSGQENAYISNSTHAEIITSLLDKDDMNGRLIRSAIIHYVDLYRVNIKDVLNFVENRHTDAVIEILGAEVSPGHKIHRKKASEGTVSSNLEDDISQLSDIGELISSQRFVRFDKVSETIENPTPYYEIYDQLTQPEKDIFEIEYKAFSLERQLKLEKHSKEIYLKQVKQVLKSKAGTTFKLMNQNKDLIHYWHTELTGLLKTPFNELVPDSEQSVIGIDQICSQYDRVDKADLAAVSLYELIRAIFVNKSDGYTVVQKIVTEIGDRYEFLINEEFQSSVFNKKYHLYKNQSLIPTGHKVYVASTILNIIVETCRFQSVDSKTLVSAFTHEFKRLGMSKNTTGIIRAHPELSGIIIKNLRKISKAFFAPMLVPPNPWTSPASGGFLTDAHEILLKQDSRTRKENLLYLSKAHDSNQLDNVYKYLDVLGSTAWAIHRKTLHVINHYIKTGQQFLDIPSELGPDDLNISPNPGYENKTKLAIWVKEKIRKQNKFYGKISERSSIEQSINLANAYAKNGEKLYFPHGVDFRGRAYPLTSTLHHTLRDSIRGLLIFWYGRPLGSSGLDWLKVHLSNLYGFDKGTREEKIKFIDENLESIKDSAENPIDGKQWWVSSDKPWQTLTVCFEITEALKSGNPETFMSRVPVHQDGSCNGLQHYAALGSDAKGGAEVNLVPSRKKRDVYSAILKLVEENVHKDMKDTQSKFTKIASLVEPLLRRKVIKRTVMTSVYGVTSYGARVQINDILTRDIEKDYLAFNKNEKSILNEEQHKFFSDADNIYTCASYIAKLTMNSIKTLFIDAKKIEDWLIHNTGRVLTSINSDQYSALRESRNGKELTNFSFGDTGSQVMTWTSLLGMPIVQLYRTGGRNYIFKTPLQYISIPRSTSSASPVDYRKQINAIPPNFIHSVDSIHLALTAVSCHGAKIEFASVHDSFWTHASDVDTLNDILRKEFINLHSIDIMSAMKDDLSKRMENCYQLVYLKSDTKSAREITKYRRDKFGKQSIKAILAEELKLENQKFHSGKKRIVTPSEIVTRNADDIYYKSGKEYYMYCSNSFEEIYSECQDIGTNKLQLLVPVQISPVPPVGDLDISQVLQSEFFFS